MTPVAWQLVACGVSERLVLRARDREDGELEWIDEDAMRWSLIVQAALGAHGEPPARDRRER